MAGRECNGLIVEEQFRPASPAHGLALHAAKLAGADDPRLVSPATPQQRPRGRVVDDAAVSHEQAALFDGDDIAEGSDTVLQRHMAFCAHEDGAPVPHALAQPIFEDQNDTF